MREDGEDLRWDRRGEGRGGFETEKWGNEFGFCHLKARYRPLCLVVMSSVAEEEEDDERMQWVGPNEFVVHLQPRPLLLPI